MIDMDVEYSLMERVIDVLEKQGKKARLILETYRTDLSPQQLAEVYHHLGFLNADKQAAFKAYSRAIQLDSDNITNWNSWEFDRFRYLLEHSENFSKTPQDKKDIARAYYNFAKYCVKNSDPNISVQYHQKALNLDNNVASKQETALFYSQLANALYGHDFDHYPRPIEYHQKSLALYEELGDKNAITDEYIALARVYESTDNPNKAIALYQKALLLNQSVDRKDKLADSYTALGGFYYSYSKPAEAIEADMKALKLNEELGNKGKMAINYESIGYIYGLFEYKAEAKYYYQKSLDMYQQLGSARAKYLQIQIDKLK